MSSLRLVQYNRVLIRGHGSLVFNRNVWRSFSISAKSEDFNLIDYSLNNQSPHLPSLTNLVENQYVKVEKLLFNDRKRIQFMSFLGKDLSELEIHHIDDTFCHLMDLTTNGDNSRALEFLCDIWFKCFEQCTTKKLSKLQLVLLDKRDIFTHILINNYEYDEYQRLVFTLVQKGVIEKKWSDELALTLKFQTLGRHHQEESFDYSSILNFLQNISIPIKKRRLMLAIFLRKGLIFSNDKPLIIRNYLLLLSTTDDYHCMFVTPEYSPYKNAIYMLSNYIEKNMSLEDVKEIFLNSNLSMESYYNFLTTLIYVNSQSHTPQFAVKIWNQKLLAKKYIDKQQKEYEDDSDLGQDAQNFDSKSILSPKDLTHTMTALLQLRRFKDVVNLSNNHPELYEEDQLTVLLKVCAEQRNWKQLQNKFDDMYGKGKLPYKIHYSIVMNALASIGASEDIEKLFKQLRKRQIDPIPSIYRALICVSLKNNDYKQADIIFEDFLIKFSGINVVDRDIEVADVYRLILEMYLKKDDVNKVLKFFDDGLKRQVQDNIELFDYESFRQLIRYFSENYLFKGVEYAKRKAEELGFCNDDVYESVIQGYTRLGQYELAEKLAFEAHHMSISPLKNAAIFAAQLKNYRVWYTETRERKVKAYIESRTSYILEQVGDVSNNNLSLIVEVVKLYIIRHQIGSAKKYLEMMIQKVKSKEEFFVPLLQFNANQNNLKNHQTNLELYGTMISTNIDISLMTYEFVMKSVLFVDKYNNKGYAKSTKLISSIFEMDFMNFRNDAVSKQRNNQREISSNALHLCSIVSSYVMHIPGSKSEKAELINTFLKRLKEKSNTQLSKVLVAKLYVEMAECYKQLNNVTMAKSLISLGINDLYEIIYTYCKEYPIKHDYDFEILVPGELTKTFKSLISLKLQIFDELNTGSHEFLELYRKCRNIGVELSGCSYSQILSKLLDIDAIPIEEVLEIVENHFAQGSLEEIALRSSFQYLYKLFLVEKSKSTSLQILNTTYKLYNEFYDINSIQDLQHELSHIADIPKEVGAQLLDIKQRYPGLGNWKQDFVFNKPGIFFIPERVTKTKNKLTPELSNRIYNFLNKQTNQRLFEFMDKYPNSIEIILLHRQLWHRLKKFRSYIDEIIEPPLEQLEEFGDRRVRTLKALHMIFC